MEPISEIAQSAFAEILLDQAVTTPLESLLQQQTPDPAQRPGPYPASQQPTPPSIDTPSRSEPELAPAIPSAAGPPRILGHRQTRTLSPTREGIRTERAKVT